MKLRCSENIVFYSNGIMWEQLILICSYSWRRMCHWLFVSVLLNHCLAEDCFCAKVQWWYFIICWVFPGLDLSCIVASMARNWWQHCLARRSLTLSSSCAGFYATLVCQYALQLLQWQLTFVSWYFSLWCGLVLVLFCCTATCDILVRIGLLDLLL